MAQVRCPTCNKSFDSDESTAMPFCSHRCREVDLGRWLREETRLPYLNPDEPEEKPDDEQSPDNGG